MSDYEMLKIYGFSPTKAAEIELDARRRDGYAQIVLSHVRSVIGCYYRPMDGFTKASRRS